MASSASRAIKTDCLSHCQQIRTSQNAQDIWVFCVIVLFNMYQDLCLLTNNILIYYKLIILYILINREESYCHKIDVSDMSKQGMEFEFGGRHLLPTQDQQQYSVIASGSSESRGKPGFAHHSITRSDLNNEFGVRVFFPFCHYQMLQTFTALLTEFYCHNHHEYQSLKNAVKVRLHCRLAFVYTLFCKEFY